MVRQRKGTTKNAQNANKNDQNGSSSSSDEETSKQLQTVLKPKQVAKRGPNPKKPRVHGENDMELDNAQTMTSSTSNSSSAASTSNTAADQLERKISTELQKLGDTNTQNLRTMKSSTITLLGNTHSTSNAQNTNEIRIPPEPTEMDIIEDDGNFTENITIKRASVAYADVIRNSESRA